MPRCIAIIWGTNDQCRNEATQYRYGNEPKFCDAHYDNLLAAEQLNTNQSKVQINVEKKGKVEVCLDRNNKNMITECTNLRPMQPAYRPGSPRSMPSTYRPGSPRTYVSSPVAPTPTIGAIQYYSQKSPRVIIPQSAPQGQVVYQSAPQGQVVYQMAPTNILDNLLTKKPKCDDIETGHECEEDNEDRFVEGRSPSRKRLIRAAPDIERNCNPPFIDFKHNEHIVECLEILDRTKDVKEGLNSMKDIINIVEKHPKNKSYNYNVTEVVVDKVAAQLARYMFDADRIELLLTFMFDYESRDLTQNMSFYGFKKDYTLTQGRGKMSFLSKSPLVFLKGDTCEYILKPRPIPEIKENMYRSYVGQTNSPRQATGDSGGDKNLTRAQTTRINNLKRLREEIKDDESDEAKKLIDEIDEDIKNIQDGSNTNHDDQYYRNGISEIKPSRRNRDKDNKTPPVVAQGRTTNTTPGAGGNMGNKIKVGDLKKLLTSTTDDRQKNLKAFLDKNYSDSDQVNSFVPASLPPQFNVLNPKNSDVKYVDAIKEIILGNKRFRDLFTYDDKAKPPTLTLK